MPVKKVTKTKKSPAKKAKKSPAAPKKSRARTSKISGTGGGPQPGSGKKKKPFDIKRATIVLERMYNGESVRNICRDEDMPRIGTVMEWVVGASVEKNKDYQWFAEQYHLAQRARSEMRQEEIVQIADEMDNDLIKDKFGTKSNAAAVARAKLRCQVRQWEVTKILPRFQDNTIKDKDGNIVPVQFNMSFGTPAGRDDDE